MRYITYISEVRTKWKENIEGSICKYQNKPYSKKYQNGIAFVSL